ncbi:MAG: 4-hydroxy-tetrahydrodipicolinate reductase [Eubacteriales bacterium]|nr:4-hydroxy-tetrahydrodipicolinate reductase [Eubacteriales bacterium]
MKKLIISGACGKMGRMLASEAPAAGFEVVAGVDSNHNPTVSFPLFTQFAGLPIPDVLIDFSSPAILEPLLGYAANARIPCVLGTTGYTDDDMAQIKKAAELFPIFHASNMSLGVYVLKKLAEQAASMLPGYDIEIIEKHHNQKSDSPSGTALTLFEAVRGANQHPVFSREGKTVRRNPLEICMHAVRGGTIPGEHEVGFYGNYEALYLSHSAQNRIIFALGALKAAQFITGQTPGLYTMEELVNALGSSHHQA